MEEIEHLHGTTEMWVYGEPTGRLIYLLFIFRCFSSMKGRLRKPDVMGGQSGIPLKVLSHEIC